MQDKNIWSHKNKAEIQVLADQLNEAIKNKNIKDVVVIFSNSENLRGLVVNRGEKNINLIFILEGFNLLISKEKEKLSLENIAPDKILEIVKINNLPEQIIAELSDVGYHLRDKELFMKVNDCVLENEKSLDNKQLRGRIIHNQSTWEEMINFDSKKAITLNLEALQLARENDDKILEHKIKFGLKISKLKIIEGEKGIKPKERIEDFQELSDVLIENGNYYDGARAKVEAAIGCYDLALLYKKEVNRLSELASLFELAKDLAKEAVAIAHEHGFATLEVTSQEMLDRICQELDLNRSAKQYGQKAKNARDKYNYKSNLKIINK